jgi:hypothetical protein
VLIGFTDSGARRAEFSHSASFQGVSDVSVHVRRREPCAGRHADELVAVVAEPIHLPFNIRRSQNIVTAPRIQTSATISSRN